MRGLSGKCAIVTGGASGIGRAIMERLCQEGVAVTFSGISDGGAATQRECQAKGYRVQFVRGDMADKAFCRRLAGEALQKWGQLNYLVNNAFSFIAKGIDATPRRLAADDGRRAHRLRDDGEKRRAGDAGRGRRLDRQPVEHLGPHRPDQPLDLQRRQGGGQPVDPLHGPRPGGGQHPRQHGQPRLDLDARSGQGGRRRPGQVGADLGQVPHAPPAGRGGRIAGPVAFLLSDEASFITAAEIMVDGGYRGMGSEGLGEASSFAGSK